MDTDLPGIGERESAFRKENAVSLGFRASAGVASAESLTA